MPVSDGMEKNVAAHAKGAAAVIDASLVKVTVSEPLPATVSGVVSVWTLPETPVEKFQITSLVDDVHPP